MVKIYLVRHGESVANTEGKYQGITYDTELSDLGIRQAQSLAKYFSKIKVDKILASPLKRTLMTAETVATKKGLEVYRELQIIETNHGLWEGKHKDEIKKTWPEIYKKWQKFPSNVRFPQGEHFLETQKRVILWWTNLIKTINQDVLVVSHDNIIRVIISNILNMKLNRIWKFHLQPTAITLVNIENEIAKLINLNNVEHLGVIQANLAIHAL